MILVPFISLVAMTIVTLALTSSHFYVLPSFPAKYLSGSSVTDGACTESQTTTFSSGLTYTLTITQAKVWHRCECVVAFFQSVFFFFFSRKLESYIWKCRNWDFQQSRSWHIPEQFNWPRQHPNRWWKKPTESWFLNSLHKSISFIFILTRVLGCVNGGLVL